MAPNNIRRLLQDRKMSQRQLAFATGIDVSDVSKCARGLRELHPAWRERIASTLNVSPESL
jgi:transcriptional regulator with XRE-family HTH domain